ncbi:MAG: metallophosphoesterase [Prolixibacteraceae bacterium]|nr:metallophosphoesterase [Prolixibacteraceae bacterium]
MIPFILFILFIAGLETYAYFGLRASLFTGFRTFNILYLLTILLTIAGIVMMLLTFRAENNSLKLPANLLFGLAFSFILAKLLLSTAFLIEDILRSFNWLIQSALRFRLAEWLHRSTAVGLIAFSLAVFIVLITNFGVWFGRYHYKTHKVVLHFDDLPAAFDGFTLVQLSDMHLGTFDQIKRFQRGLDRVQELQPDLLVFTGDMVNNLAGEAEPYIEAFSKLEAPFGKFSVLGNHDYGEYVQWKNPGDKEANLERLKKIENEMGFRLLLNEKISLVKGQDTIYLAGVENWGEPPFPQYGKLNQTMQGLSADDFVILLSHDPTHWREEVIHHPATIKLTLSGHTHGMQFGIEIGKFKWSPVKYRYADWAGLFTENNRHLYVNRGFGSIGYPGRVGIRPEITLIELRKK